MEVNEQRPIHSCITVPNTSISSLQKTRRKSRSQRLRRHSLLPLPRRQPRHPPHLQTKTRPLLLVPPPRHLGLHHRLHRRRLEVLPPKPRAPMATIHALHPGRVDHIRTRAAPGPLFETASRESEREAAPMGPRHDYRCCIPDDHPHLAARLAGV